MSVEKEMVIVSETHWDREWYLPFQEYRARLVILVDKLLKILEEDPKFTNFTFDGQTVVLEDYLEVKPENKPLLQKYIREGRISVGPWYVLPDEFLVSGEALIRNLMLGHKIARDFGRVMRAGYIPDPFGHIAQLPQIMQGFDIDSVLFMRGMDDSDEKLGLNLEFNWHSPGKVASVLAIHLRYGYGSVSELPTRKREGVYRAALKKIRKVQQKILKRTAASILLLNNGSDHNEVQGELPEIIENWNDSLEFNEYKLVQNDFEYYIERLRTQNLKLKHYEGELRGARYHPILSGVFSARMWIKQFNTECQYLLENWVEPFATFAWMLGELYPQNYIWAGWKWLLRNHPHDSICGCSVDEVHQDMRTRFVWAKQIAEEITKTAMHAIYKRVRLARQSKKSFPFMVFNPLPWNRTDIATIDITLPSTKQEDFQFEYNLIDSSGKNIPFQLTPIVEKARFQTPKTMTCRLSFLAERIPACGYEVFSLQPQNTPQTNASKADTSEIENEYFRIIVHENGTFTLIDKELNRTFENLGIVEDVGDWGDEYDYSPPQELENDRRITNEGVHAEVRVLEAGPAKKTIQSTYILQIPSSLTEDRKVRSELFRDLPVKVSLTLYPKIKRVDIDITLRNQSEDHRLRMLFPTGIKARTVSVDGHFAIIERTIELPEGQKWKQAPSKTNHQLKYVSVNDGNVGLAVFNRGLPEYEPVEEAEGSATLAITLLRCVGWLSLAHLVSRKEIAGPAFATPEAQNLGEFSCSLSLTTHQAELADSKNIQAAFEFNLPLKAFNPAVMRTAFRVPDHIFFRGVPIILPPDPEEEKTLPIKQSFLEISPIHLILSACKKAEEGAALVLRVYNSSKTTSTGTIKLFRNIRAVETINMDEKSMAKSSVNNLNIDKNQFTFQIDGAKIVTFKISY
jgi:mannosylglycerate hydrolase